MKKFLLGLFAIIVLLVAATLYAFTGRTDLGTKIDRNFVTSFESKYAPTDDSPQVSLDVTLTDSEISSIFAVWEDRDRFFPLRDVQIRFSPDGTGEASGYLKIGTAIALAKNLGYADSDIDTAKKYINYISGDLPFYVKGTGGMTNNVLSINPNTFKIGRVTVPGNITQAATAAVQDMIHRRLKQIGGADVKEASFATGAFHFVGTVPSTIKY